MLCHAVLDVPVNSMKILEEFWATRRTAGRFCSSFGRHGALPEDLGGVLGVMVRSLKMLKEL